MTIRRTTLLALSLLFGARATSAQQRIDLAPAASGSWLLFNRGAALVTDGSRRVLTLDERANGGLVWNPALQLADGDIDVDVRGRDILQKSFLGVAFHMASADSFEVLWLRPFNFQGADSARRAHAVQYASYPEFTWQALREQYPGGYESAVPPGIKPNGWVHMHIELRGTHVSLFLNGAASPTLSVESRGDRRGGGVGLWVGDNSPGEFTNLVITPRAAAPAEQYGFVALLGRDTISVERITRTSDRMVSDQVDRFPRVIQRHTEILLAPDNSIRHLTMDLRLPTAVTPKWRERHVTVEYLRDSVRVTIRHGEGSNALTLATNGALTMPWSPQMYSLIELYFAAAARRMGDSVTVRLIFPDAQIEETRLGRGFARVARNGKFEVFRHDMLAGTGEATLDAAGRMVAYSGARTTFKNEVTRVATPPDVEAIGRQFAETERRANDIVPLSVRDTTRATIGAASFLVDYGRPRARGRELVGNGIPYGEVWRTGANAATQFTTSAAVTVGGLELAPGTYTLWTLPSANGIVLIVNNQSGQWGTQYDSTRDLGRIPLDTRTVMTPIEPFTISALATDTRTGTLVLEWGSFRWTAPLVLK